MKVKSSKRTISGDSKVTIYSPSSDKKIYLAKVQMNGRYPEKGIAFNVSQTEAVFVISGELEISIDGEKEYYSKGDVVYFEEGKKYTVSGVGEALVAITPGEGGKTQIED